jgi:malic enzyme
MLCRRGLQNPSSRDVQLLQDNLGDMFSVVYTPTEGDAIQNYSRLFRRPEGCFLNINDAERVHDDLAMWGDADDVDYIVVTGRHPSIPHASHLQPVGIDEA